MKYSTLKTTSEALFKDRGSKFIGYAFPLSSEDAFKEYLNQLKAQHKGAVHFCSAFRIGFPDVLERSNDDGEPSGSAGKPILNQLLSAEITCCGIIVVRYFGGTKLGVGGLISAYKEAAKLAIEANIIIETTIKATFQLTFPYEITGEVNAILNQFDAETIDKSYTEKCELFVKINWEKRLDFSKTNEHLHLLIIKEIDS